eukprot:12235107-Prorocentrum_lima.AAC.1
MRAGARCTRRQRGQFASESFFPLVRGLVPAAISTESTGGRWRQQVEEARELASNGSLSWHERGHR